MLTDFHTSTMKFRQLMARIDLFLRGQHLFKKVASHFARSRILPNPCYQNESNEWHIYFISKSLNICNHLLTPSIIITILTIYGHKIMHAFDYTPIFNLMNDRP